MASRAQKILFGGAVYVGTAYLFYHYYSPKDNQSNANSTTSTPGPKKITIDETHRQTTYAKMAHKFDLGNSQSFRLFDR